MFTSFFSLQKKFADPCSMQIYVYADKHTPGDSLSNGKPIGVREIWINILGFFFF